MLVPRQEIFIKRKTKNYKDDRNDEKKILYKNLENSISI